MEAIRLAIEEEREGKLKYQRYAASAATPEIRMMFEQLAREEESHERRLVEKLQALKLLYLDD